MKKYIFLTIIFMFITFISVKFVFAIDNNVICTLDTMKCPDGSWVGRSGPNCEFICDDLNKRNNIDLAKPPIDIDCYNLYEPVCALPPLPECLLNHMCKMPQPGPTTYTNECVAKNNGSKILYEGRCQDDLKTIDVVKIDNIDNSENKNIGYKNSNDNSSQNNRIRNDFNLNSKIKIIDKIQDKKFLGIFPFKIKTKLYINIESGQLLKEDKPWYSFLLF